MSENGLIAVVKEAGLPEAQTKMALEQFQGFFNHASKFEEEARAIEVTGVEQVDEMARARELRLELKHIRVETEKRRKVLKAQSLREGKAIDGMANIIKAIVVPLEEHLTNQEMYAENQEKKRRAALATIREEELGKLCDYPRTYNLEGMSEDEYEAVKIGLEAQRDKKIADEKKAEEERLAEIERQKKIEAENERLRKEAEKKKKEHEAALEKERKEREAEAAKIRAEEEKKLKAEREKREAIEKEMRERKAEEDRIAEEQRKAELKAQRAPDKKKLEQLGRDLALFPLPEVKSNAAQAIIDAVSQDLSNLIAFVAKETNEL